MLSQPPAGVPAPLYRPGAILWLGILDLVFASTGLLFIAIQSISLLFRQPHGSTFYRGDGSEIFLKQPSFHPFEIVELVVSVVTTALIIIAGIRLIRQHHRAVTASNRYAWASIAGKILNLIVPMMTIATMQGSLGEPGLPTGGFLPLEGVIYPVLCLILLNRKPVKDWLAAYGTR